MDALAPDYAAPVMGIRGWWGLSGELKSVVQPHRWSSGELEATCTYLRHPAPHPGCRCGYWAYRDYETYREHDNFRDQMWTHVVGVVEAKGIVIEHEQGFRAQRVEIAAFIRPEFELMGEMAEVRHPYLEEETMREAKNYGVEVLEPESVDEFCASRGVVFGDQGKGSWAT